MGCGSSSGIKEKLAGKMGGGGFKVKKGVRCLALHEATQEERIAIVTKLEKEGNDETAIIFFPELEPSLGSLPKGTDAESRKAWLEEQKKAVLSAIPFVGTKSTETKVKADTLKECPFPKKAAAGGCSETKVQELDDFCIPAGEVIATFGALNNVVFEAWKQQEDFTREWLIPFPQAVKTLAGICSSPAALVKKASEDIKAFSGDFEVAVVKVLHTLLKACFDAIEKLPELITNLTKAVEGFQALVKVEEGQSPTDKFKSVVEGAGLQGLDAIMAVKNIATNLKVLAAAPGNLTAFLQSCKFLVGICKNALGGKEEGKEEGKAEGKAEGTPVAPDAAE